MNILYISMYTVFLELQIFSNFINVFTVTFDQFNASMLNTNSILFSRLLNEFLKVCVSTNNSREEHEIYQV